MLRSVDSNTEVFLDSLRRISERMENAQRQVSTGLRFSSVSDDPDHVSTLLQARADLGATQTMQADLGRVKAEVDGGEQALESAVSIVERIRTLGSQGATDTATPESRQAIAEEVGSLLEQLGGISRTTVEGRYIFSGDTDQNAPYAIDLSQTNPISAYAGSSSTRQVQHPNGTRFGVARTAQEIFDSPQASENVFYSVDAIRKALLANDGTAIKNSLSNVIGSLNYLNGQLAHYGTVQNKVAGAIIFGQSQEMQLKTHVGTLEDTDISEAILEFQQAATQQQAALESHAKMPLTSLFDYLG